MTSNKLASIVAALVLICSASVPQLATAADAPPPPAVLESFFCNWNPGKDMGDLMAARDGYVKAAEKAGLPLTNSFVWTRFKGISPAQVIWHNVHQNLDAWAAHEDAQYAVRDAMASAGQRLQDTMTCQPGLGTVRPVYVREGTEPGGDSVISVSACSVRHGISPANVNDLADHVAGVIGGLGDNGPNALYMISPMMSGADAPDVVLVGIHDSAAAWARVVGAVSGSEAGQRLGRHFNSTLDCTQSLWGSTQVVAIEE